MAKAERTGSLCFRARSRNNCWSIARQSGKRMHQKRRRKTPGVVPLSPPRTDAELVQAFIDAVVSNPAKAKRIFSEHPRLKDARVLHGETILHFFAVES